MREHRCWPASYYLPLSSDSHKGQDQWTNGGVGFDSRVGPVQAIVIGLAANAALALAFSGITHLIGIRDRVRDSGIATIAGLFPESGASESHC